MYRRDSRGDVHDDAIVRRVNIALDKYFCFWKDRSLF